MLLRNENNLNDGQVSVRAVLTRKQYALLASGQATLEIPYGSSMVNKTGSVVLQFDCEDRNIAEELCDGLDISGISWDEIYD